MRERVSGVSLAPEAALSPNTYDIFTMVTSNVSQIEHQSRVPAAAVSRTELQKTETGIAGERERSRSRSGEQESACPWNSAPLYV